MAEIQASAFTGVERNNVRPGEFIRQTDVEAAAKDQAYLYERITGVKVSGSGTIQATPHVHSGLGDGAIIPIPLCQSWLNLSMAPADSGVDTISPFVRVPVFIPAGVDDVQITFNSPGPTDAAGVVVFSYDSSLTYQDTGFPIQSAGHWSGAGAGGGVATCTVGVTAGEVNVFYFYAPDSEYAYPARTIFGFQIHPVTTGPVQAIKAQTPTLITASEYNTPTDYISIDTTLVGVDRSLNSWLLTTMAKNDQVNFELATNWPAGAKSTSDVTGHVHADGTVAAGTCGAGIDHVLGCWTYGVARAPDLTSGTSSNFMTLDHDGSANNETWSGRIYGPHWTSLRSSASANIPVGKHRFRVPIQADGNLGVSPSSANKIKVAVLWRTNHTSTSSTVRATVYDDALSTSGATTTIGTGNGNDTIHLDTAAVQLPAALSGGGDNAVLEIDMNGYGSVAGTMIHGVCIYYEA